MILGHIFKKLKWVMFVLFLLSIYTTNNNWISCLGFIVLRTKKILTRILKLSKIFISFS